VTVLKEFEFRIVTELLGLTEDLPISLQLLLSASRPTIDYFSRIATESLWTGICRHCERIVAKCV